MRWYNVSTVYEFFNNIFPVGCGRPYLNLYPMPIYDIPNPNKIACYTSDTIPNTITVTSINSVSNLTTPSNLPQIIVMNYYDHNTQHTTNIDKSFHGRGEIGYHSRLHDGIRL